MPEHDPATVATVSHTLDTWMYGHSFSDDAAYKQARAIAVLDALAGAGLLRTGLPVRVEHRGKGQPLIYAGDFEEPGPRFSDAERAALTDMVNYSQAAPLDNRTPYIKARRAVVAMLEADDTR